MVTSNTWRNTPTQSKHSLQRHLKSKTEILLNKNIIIKKSIENKRTETEITEKLNLTNFIDWIFFLFLATFRTLTETLVKTHNRLQTPPSHSKNYKTTKADVISWEWPAPNFSSSLANTPQLIWLPSNRDNTRQSPMNSEHCSLKKNT